MLDDVIWDELDDFFQSVAKNYTKRGRTVDQTLPAARSRLSLPGQQGWKADQRWVAASRSEIMSPPPKKEERSISLNKIVRGPGV